MILAKDLDKVQEEVSALQLEDFLQWLRGLPSTEIVNPPFCSSSLSLKNARCNSCPIARFLQAKLLRKDIGYNGQQAFLVDSMGNTIAYLNSPTWMNPVAHLADNHRSFVSAGTFLVLLLGRQEKGYF